MIYFQKIQADYEAAKNKPKPELYLTIKYT